MINQETRWIVYARSGRVCEQCHVRVAAHLHHLTYERAGNELPEDLLDICALCHARNHPGKFEEILEWELRRKLTPAEIERKEALQQDLDAQREETERLQKEQMDRWDEEHPPRALNLGKYIASGYCLEDVEAEERSRNGD